MYMLGKTWNLNFFFRFLVNKYLPMKCFFSPQNWSELASGTRQNHCGVDISSEDYALNWWSKHLGA